MVAINWHVHMQTEECLNDISRLAVYTHLDQLVHVPGLAAIIILVFLIRIIMYLECTCSDTADHCNYLH